MTNIYQGSSYNMSLQVKDISGNAIDLTDYTASGNLKYRYSDTTPLASFEVTRETPYISGLLSATLSDEITAELPITVALFDIELYHSNGSSYKALRGHANIIPEVTI